MGLGKTLQVACFLALQRATERELQQPTMIVAPVILLKNWEEELAKFFRPDVFRPLIVLYGDELRRRKRNGALDIGALRDTAYVLTNYETLQSHQQSLLMVDWNVVVLDEAQHIKNRDTYRARAARGLKRKFGVCSTGTPVENRLGDLWSLYDFLSPGNPFTTPEAFFDEFEQDVNAGIQQIRTRLNYPSPSSSLMRRTKAEVLSLPPKTVEVHTIAMTPRQVELERQVTRRGQERRNILSILQGLQQLYQHPRLLASDSERGEVPVERAIEESPKLALSVDILRRIQAAGEKALVFTLWTDMQALLVSVLKSELGLQRVRVINGDPKQRRNAHEYIHEFSNTDGFNVMVLSPLAAGTGLTITAANHVVHYGRWWNPAKEDQATDRAYRIGQTKPVHVHYPLLHHPGRKDVGFDVKLHELVEKKRGVARDFLAPQPQDDISIEDLTRLQES
jgi:SNF2 family DNA or RNA helicase